MARGILRDLRAARQAVLAEIRSNSKGFYGAGLASEGYAGGYRDALSDVEAMLLHGYPSDTRGYWRKARERSKATEKADG